MADETKKVEVLKPYAQTFSEAVQAGIKAGDLKLDDNSVTAKIDKLGADGSLTKVDFSKSYQKLVALTPAGALILASERTEKGGDNEKTLLQMVTDSYDAGVRSNVRAAIVQDATGPEAGIKKAAATLAKTFNLPIETVLEMIRTNPVIKAQLEAQVAADSKSEAAQTEAPAEAATA